MNADKLLEALFNGTKDIPLPEIAKKIFLEDDPKVESEEIKLQNVKNFLMCTLSYRHYMEMLYDLHNRVLELETLVKELKDEAKKVAVTIDIMNGASK